MFDARIVIYTLSSLLLVLTIVLATKIVRNRLSEPENPWYTPPIQSTRKRRKKTFNRPNVVPPPHLFRHR